MSYASDMKKELTMIELTDDPQFLSELSALIKMNGVLSISNMKLALTFQTENASIARRMFSLIKHFYDVDINISVRKKLKLKKNNVYICRLEERVKEILRDLYILNDNYTLKTTITKTLIDSDEKKRAYLRGAFLAGGSVNNPRTSSYHLEIFSQYEEHSKELLNLMNTYDLNARVIERKKGFIVYIKESEKISDFINIVGAVRALFQFEDERIVRDLNNAVNRMNNCDIANINKMVNAATKQVEDINVIEERLGLEQLDEKLRVVALARLEHQELPLKDLAEQIEDGKLSKSGLNHRFRKIARIAQELREGIYEV
ncbi:MULTISPECIES: DNA-binding protein WhiA [unclassified Gemella]|uniref:DNA-binding protein WhiA n=1 Tax=unclassified Gemella TaxID=2624949 RepID=UPI0010738CA3|nr:MULTISPECIES: DNA-binding protein WhiA [unclassified Gemella]MBF0710717.1 DNA-binding protein WhiA [Gemella sp. GL1.1]MBF0746714.1 DNA-binding protein WhiA [Gemella sp. 19428wG2_WT2a]NYS28061.1 DNA-binding protein WhiA [Gemella sp. GL1]TFU60063.1 DNA-binding protein WhiA [Gemella sp. WT2a]